MTPLDFLQAVWPDTGHYCLATPFTIPGTNARVYAHKVVTTIEQAAAYAEQYKNKSDIFFAVHSMAEPRVWNPKKLNRKTNELGAWEYRVQSNMQAVRCFFFDLDVHPSNDRKYPSQQAAIADLRRFCKETGLPRPLITSSGGGVHVYWPLTSSLPSAAWLGHAQQLKQLAVSHGLKADPARTADTASVLRVVGTYNLKDPLNPRAVTALTPTTVTPTDKFLDILLEATIRAGISAAEAPQAPRPSDDLLGSNITDDYTGPPTTLKAVVTACAQMRRLVGLRGNVSEPEWYHTINLVRFLEKGEKLVHRVSEGHPQYDAEQTTAKVHQLEAKGIKPTSCAKLADVCGADLCKGCPFNGKVKSPIVAARYRDPAPAPVLQQLVGTAMHTSVVPDAPYPFSRLKSGDIAMTATNNKGDEINMVIYNHDIYPVRRLANSATESEQQVWRVNLPISGPKDFIIDADALYDRKKFQNTISNQGIYPKSANIQHLQDYMIAYIAELQRLTDADAQNNHLGWIDDQTKFIMPDKILLADGTAKPAMLSLGAQRSSAQIHKRGTLERQIELMKFYDHPGFILNQFFVLCGLASPIFYATGHHGIVINASGEAGSSKSTTLYTAASLWGQPELYPINGTNNGATVRGRNERVTTLANLPICVDEITHMPVKDAVDLAMSVTQPGHRIRLTQEGIERGAIGSYKATMLLATANNSLHGLLSADNAAGTAGSMRVFEMVFRPTGVYSKYEADDYWHDLKENYGHIGEVFISYVVQNQKLVSDRVRAVMREIDTEAKILASERFWSAAIAAALTAGEIANQLGLLPYDIAEIKQYILRKQIPFMRGIVREEYSNPIGTLAEYLEMINGDILVVNKPLQGGNISFVAKAPRGQLLARYDIDDKILWVLKKNFRDYCTRTGNNAYRILEDLTNPMAGPPVIIHKHSKKVLGMGTDYAKAQSWCFAMNMAHTDVTGTIDLEVIADISPALSRPHGKLKLVPEVRDDIKHSNE